MIRTEYLKTIEGQSYERLKRMIKTIYLEIDQEPKGKNSYKKEKIFFREEVKRQLREMERRPFKGDIILEIDYFTTKNNPPALQTLSKNYLDLLHKSMPEIDSYENLLFKDDSQVKILISNYHLNESGKQKPKIMIKAYSLRYFYADIELADRILSNDFIERDDYRHSRLEDDLQDDYELWNRNSDYSDDLKDLEKNKNFYVSSYGEKYYTLQKHFYTRQIQEQFLKINSFNIRNLISLFQPYFPKNKKYSNEKVFQNIWYGSKKLIFFSWSFLDFGGAPLNEGEKIIFKENIKNELDKFKQKFKILFPLLHPINVIITYLPPKRNIVDLDNLARYVVPLVNEIFEPPATYQLTYDQKYLNEILKKEVEIVQRFPPNSIASYQLMHIPRQEKDPEEGEIKFVISDGLGYSSNVWVTVNDLIRKWEDKI